jgi:hypothetical protein
MMENNYGCSSYLTNEIAAITSEEQSRELISIASIISSEKVSVL